MQAENGIPVVNFFHTVYSFETFYSISFDMYTNTTTHKGAKVKVKVQCAYFIIPFEVLINIINHL